MFSFLKYFVYHSGLFILSCVFTFAYHPEDSSSDSNQSSSSSVHSSAYGK